MFNSITKVLVILIIVIIGLILLSSIFVIIRQQNVGIVETFGKYSTTWGGRFTS